MMCLTFSHQEDKMFTKHNSSFQLDFIQLTKLHFEMKAPTLFQQDRMELNFRCVRYGALYSKMSRQELFSLWEIFTT